MEPFVNEARNHHILFVLRGMTQILREARSDLQHLTLVRWASAIQTRTAMYRRSRGRHLSLLTMEPAARARSARTHLASTSRRRCPGRLQLMPFTQQ